MLLTPESSPPSLGRGEAKEQAFDALPTLIAAGYTGMDCVPRLRRHGVTDEQIHTLLVENPRQVFSAR